jgi:hypothetical protein
VPRATRRRNRCSPPRTSNNRPTALDLFWARLTDEQRQRTLATLSSIVIRQLDAPRGDPEVRDETP